ncbi:periplasmic chaperone for outer membrane proteins Skp [Saccharicrinis carchari]|uniref:Periplasmic chaperone for outer membrane proteins Skp n=1 Tax=Saccharicrinis carchari TaxID=1168039 RepID=A0A521CPH2_SACCC|nr:OmpH family outer membrane protein [Saccharicrinis carchari]SMO60661.1 periplasmic chaperone for outer membrane proteins Skp [Saccharicrinis carchari]
MKSIKLLFVVVAVVFSSSAFGQELKFGHVNIQKLVTELPDKVAADKKLQNEAQKLEQNLKVMNEELDAKYTDYMQKRDTLPELIRATKEKEIQEISERLKNFQMLAQQNLQQQEQQLLQPIIEKIQKAIDEVGAENGFIYIFDISSRVVIYHSEQSTDVEDLVKAKLAATAN